MKNPELKEAFLNTRIQQIEIAKDGTILASDDVLFTLKNNSNIGKYHPFFEGLASLLPELSERITFPCVNVAVGKTEKILDIEIVLDKDAIFLLFFDFTKHYIDSHPLVQEKNEAAIAKERLAFEKRLLLAKENFKNEFLAHLNHEIRNPLNNLLGFMELLRKSKLSYDQNETLKVMQRTGTQIKQLMEDMLDISKMERGVITVQHVPFNLGHIITNLQQHYQLKIKNKTSDFTVTIDDNVPKKLIGDPVRLNQILFNLLENAFRHAPEASVHLHVVLEEKEKENCTLTISVSDTGDGIPNDKIETIFDSYYQLRLKNDAPIGEGLGLKIVKDLVDVLNGSIAVTSNEKGTSFNAKLPFELRKTPEKRPTVPKGSGILLSKRILVVENNETSQMLFMRTFLNNDHGFILEIASSASHAFKILNKKPVNLVIIKNKLPDSTAISFLEKIKVSTIKNASKIPVLVTSGSTMLQEQKVLLEAGAAGFLAKPYTQKELFNTIEKLHL